VECFLEVIFFLKGMELKWKRTAMWKSESVGWGLFCFSVLQTKTERDIYLLRIPHDLI